jgi:hypothetical protein
MPATAEKTPLYVIAGDNVASFANAAADAGDGLLRRAQYIIDLQSNLAGSLILSAQVDTHVFF